MRNLGVVLSIACLPFVVHAIELHVSPKGDDRASGSVDAPLASMNGARLAVRKLPRPLAESVRIVFSAGIYSITKEIAFDENDSGEDGVLITYESAPGAEVIISGGKELPPFSVAKGVCWTLRTPLGTEAFEQLWIDDRRATRARSSGPGTRFIKGVQSEDPIARANPISGFSEQVISVDPNELSAFRDICPDETRDAVVTFYHKWDSSRSRVESADYSSGTLRVRGPAQKANTAFNHLTSMVMENVLGLLDEPGEWFLGRSGDLSYIPRVGESIETSRAIYPVTEKLVTIKGKASKNVANLIFRGLRFRHAKGLPSLATAIPNQAAVGTVDGVITLEHARKVMFIGCELSHVGGYGFSLRQGSREVSIEKCLISDLGAGGVKIGTPNDEAKPENHASHNRLHNNIIRDGGLIFPCAVGVWIGSSSDNEVTHNEISDFFYSAVSVGWRWGYAHSNAKRNRVEWNHLHHLGKGLLSDMGGVYLLGPSEGTSVSHNHIHDVMCLEYGGWGLYADEGSSGIIMEGNVIHDTTDGGFHQHFGRDNLVRNNVFAFSNERQIIRTRAEEHLSFSFEHNIVIYSRGELLTGNWTGTTSNFINRNNLYWDITARPVVFGEKKLGLAEWQKKGQDIGSLVADPLFIDSAKRDFRLNSNSPALALGIKSIDVSAMGVLRKDDAWRKLAKSFDRDQSFIRTVRPVASPLNIRQRFEFVITSHSSPFPNSIAGLSVKREHGERNRPGLADELLISTVHKAEGKQSLLFRDAPGLSTQSFPMLSFNPHHRAGTSYVSFALYLEPKAFFTHEWRSQGDRCRSGPIMHIRNGRLTGVKGLDVVVPLKKWIRFELSSMIGDAVTGYWNLKVTPEGEPTSEFYNLPCRHPDMKSLDWVGFISNADEATEFYLDDLVIRTDDTSR